MCIYADGHDADRARLESHAIAYDTLHHTVVPWLRRGGASAWVQARSTAPFAQHPAALPAPSERAQSEGRALLEAVKARFGSDHALLPAPRDGAHAGRYTVSTYFDEARGHVLLVYAPPGPSARLEFVSFSLTGGKPE